MSLDVGRAGGDPDPVPFPAAIDGRSVSLAGLFVLALLYTSYVARVFVVPLILALLLEMLFSPLVRRLRRLRVPPALSAAVIVALLVGVVGGGVYSLSAPATEWVARAPQSLERLEAKARILRRPLERFTRTAARVEELAAVDGADKTLEVRVKNGSLTGVLFGETQDILGSALVVVVLLYFLLASDDLFLAKVLRTLPRLQDKKRAVQIARETEDHVSRYLVATTLVNIAFGLVVAGALALMGLPNPLLWGVIAGVTNFVPYLGAVATAVVIGLAALLQFDDTGYALLVPAVFLVLNALEGYVLTPMLVGRRLMLNPVVVFVGVLFWGWIWGIAGAVMAVPLLATFKIFCDHIEGLAPVSELLGP